MWQPDTFAMAVVSASVFGLVGIILILLGFKLFDWITPRINLEVELAEKKNIAVAIVIAALIIGVSIVLAAVVGA